MGARPGTAVTARKAIGAAFIRGAWWARCGATLLLGASATGNVIIVPVGHSRRAGTTVAADSSPGTAEAPGEHLTGRRPARLPSWAFPVALICAAFFFRIWIGHLFSYYGADAPSYTVPAQNLAAGHGYSFSQHAPYLATDIRLPGYPALLAVAFVISDSHWSVIILNSLLGAVSTFLVWLISLELNLTRTRALWATGIAAAFLSTASFAGVAETESLSVPGVMAFVYLVLLRPPRSRRMLFVGGSLLAWLVELTRDELALFVVLVAIVAARRANLRALASVALVICFLLGSGAWTLRNNLQVHRTELVDSVRTDEVLVASVNGNEGGKVYRKAGKLLHNPVISQSARTEYQKEAYSYIKDRLVHHFPTYVRSKVTYYATSLFPVPIYGVSYNTSLKFLMRFGWAALLALGYLFAFVTTRRWWKSGRRTEVVSIWLFPVFILCFEVIFQDEFRYVLPATLLLLPLVVEGVAYTVQSEREKWRRIGAGGPSP